MGRSLFAAAFLLGVSSTAMGQVEKSYGPWQLIQGGWYVAEYVFQVYPGSGLRYNWVYAHPNDPDHAYFRNPGYGTNPDGTRRKGYWGRYIYSTDEYQVLEPPIDRRIHTIPKWLFERPEPIETVYQDQPIPGTIYAYRSYLLPPPLPPFADTPPPPGEELGPPIEVPAPPPVEDEFTSPRLVAPQAPKPRLYLRPALPRSGGY